jgi:NitT/TauT family transport system permease protein
VAIVPILVIWFGIGAVPTLEPELRDVLRSLGARPRDILL